MASWILLASRRVRKLTRSRIAAMRLETSHPYLPADHYSGLISMSMVTNPPLYSESFDLRAVKRHAESA